MKKKTIEKRTPLSKCISTQADLLNLKQLTLKEKEEIIFSGITKSDLIQIKKILELDYDTLGNLFLTTTRTLHSIKGSSKYRPYLSNMIMSILELYSFGYEVMGDFETFQSWMTSTNRSLMNERPIDLIGTYPGYLAVTKALNNIQFGLL